MTDKTETTTNSFQIAEPLRELSGFFKEADRSSMSPCHAVARPAATSAFARQLGGTEPSRARARVSTHVLHLAVHGSPRMDRESRPGARRFPLRLAQWPNPARL